MSEPSRRIAEAVAALPLQPGMRVLEIGCGPGSAARLVASRIGNGHVLAIDRSSRAIEQAIRGSRDEIATGRLRYRLAHIETFVREKGEPPFDLAFGLRVGVLDGRHPAEGRAALARLTDALQPLGRLFTDGGDPLLEINPFDADIR